MYIYTLQAMPGYKAKFEGDTSVKYKVRRENTSAAKDKCRTDIRTDLSYPDAAALVTRFNDKEREARSINKEAASRHATHA
ncbi:MAG: hypothetical protein QOJ70_2662 [Acidobacteriota bacterium]|jgi:hypothetical protein|nr:hypothetical protein [Acidobacteriota bacterium]MDT7808849.1 hypothetical protein [Acidobacteriota bacterium]